jgi:hypothetical protein
MSLVRAMLILLSCTLIACTEVRPWEKGNFAKWHMAMDPIPLEKKFCDHIYQSKEGSAGGYGVGGGGCGCN